MALNLAKKIAGAEEFKKGNEFYPGRGRVIIQDIKVIKTRNDPDTFIVETRIKESHPVSSTKAPNAPGTEATYMQLMNRWEGAEGRVKTVLKTILGPDSENLTDDELAGQVSELLRLDDSGHTKDGTKCPVAGVELDYETFDTENKKGEARTFAKFRHVPVDREVVKANRALLGAK